jgi:hypothetical protein
MAMPYVLSYVLSQGSSSCPFYVPAMHGQEAASVPGGDPAVAARGYGVATP